MTKEESLQLNDELNNSNTQSSSPQISQSQDISIKRKKIKWTDKHIDILVDWGDKAMCYRWLHSRNTDRYRSLNTWFTIPVIIMSTLTGTANFAQEQVPLELRSYYSMIVGSVNILAGIITTIQNFLKISQLNESHRVASISWDKFYRKIKLELAKAPDERSDVELFLKNCSEEFDRLIETSPDIDRTILKKFKDTFEGKKSISQNIKDKLNRKLQIDQQGEIVAITERQKAFKELNKPSVYDYLESVKSSVYKEPESKTTVKTENLEILIENNHSQQNKEPEKMITEKASNVIHEIVKRKKNLEEKEKKINHFCNEFKEKYSRDPTEEEIIENLENDQEKITKAIITGFISKIREKKHNQNINIDVNEINNTKTENKKDDHVIDILIENK